MKRHYISSSVIRWYGYDPDTGALEIEFNSGHIYRYAGVPAYAFAAMGEKRFAKGERNGPVDHFERRTPEAKAKGGNAAPSKGQYFDYNIREKFPTERLR
jgi:hypothetical protein